MKGGFWRAPHKDGINVVASGISNTMNTPVEVLEMAFPVRIERYEINPDSGGAGRYRGGCGSRRTWRLLAGADATGALCMERMTSPPFGLLGGKAGAAAVVTLTTPDGVTRHLPSKGASTACQDRWSIVPRVRGFGKVRHALAHLGAISPTATSPKAARGLARRHVLRSRQGRRRALALLRDRSVTIKRRKAVPAPQSRGVAAIIEPRAAFCPAGL
jgi:N-methylhydantoinase B/oxoprolinase/acetone carboxylase alpha subunit